MAYGNHAQSDWDAAKNEVLSILREHAPNRRTIAYSELSALIQAIRFDAEGRDFHYLLGEVAEDENRECRGLISCLVVHKNDDRMPGKGFFELCRKYGRTKPDRLGLWIDELERVAIANSGRPV